ncbi:hypothetical protein REPUB_Repub05bG0126400 [Reevesia pubescens]
MWAFSYYTQEAETNWAPDCQIPAALPIEELRSIRKRKGKRRRKDCSKDAKEGKSVEESEFLGLADVASASQCKETSASNSAQIARFSGIDEQSGSSSKEGIDDIMGVFSSVAENDCASVF